ncbi:Gfo/Idh/MocA family oxidoreductase [Streptomyces sp. NPDC088124]|uniref:Gfo/Idh/MocA family protein n=1 Tax=Streptomyces sp. NPDC088124 TaxID=3154654 RepID=UPI003422B1D4
MPHEIGLIGATGIAERAVLAPAARREDIRVRAVAAHTPDRATAFRARHGLPGGHAGYRELLDDEAVDTVYISLHNTAHAQWAVEAARAAKNVVIEKPLCLGRRELHALRHAASATGVHVVEAVMTADHPWQAAVRDLIDSAELGALTAIHSYIGFEPPDRRGYRFRPELGGGAFLDTASYWLQAVQATAGLDGATPGGRSDFGGPGGVDLEFTATLDLPSGARATLHATLGEGYRADHEFVFTRGRVRLRNFLRPAAGPLPVNLHIAPDGAPRRVLSFPASCYYDDQLDRFLTRVSAPPADQWRAVAERVSLMEDCYLAALAAPGASRARTAPSGARGALAAPGAGTGR